MSPSFARRCVGPSSSRNPTIHPNPRRPLPRPRPAAAGRGAYSSGRRRDNSCRDRSISRRNTSFCARSASFTARSASFWARSASFSALGFLLGPLGLPLGPTCGEATQTYTDDEGLGDTPVSGPEGSGQGDDTEVVPAEDSGLPPWAISQAMGPLIVVVGGAAAGTVVVVEVDVGVLLLLWLVSELWIRSDDTNRPPWDETPGAPMVRDSPIEAKPKDTSSTRECTSSSNATQAGAVQDRRRQDRVLVLAGRVPALQGAMGAVCAILVLLRASEPREIVACNGDTMPFQLNQRIFIPEQGVAIISRIIDTGDPEGPSCEIVLLKTGMKCATPLARLGRNFERTLIPEGGVDVIYRALRSVESPVEHPSWQREYAHRIRSGDPMLGASVLRELTWHRTRRTLSTEETATYDQALSLLVQEIAVVRGADEDTIAREIGELLAEAAE